MHLHGSIGKRKGSNGNDEKSYGNCLKGKTLRKSGEKKKKRLRNGVFCESESSDGD